LTFRFGVDAARWWSPCRRRRYALAGCFPVASRDTGWSRGHAEEGRPASARYCRALLLRRRNRVPEASPVRHESALSRRRSSSLKGGIEAGAAPVKRETPRALRARGVAGLYEAIALPKGGPGEEAAR